MSNANVPAYLDNEAAVALVLTSTDEDTLAALEEGWLAQASQHAAPSDWLMEQTEWTQWLANSPAYRALAYYDDFSSAGASKPGVLLEVATWRDDPDLQPILEKVGGVVNAAPVTTGAVAGGGHIVGIGGMGLLIIAGLAWLILSDRR